MHDGDYIRALGYTLNQRERKVGRLATSERVSDVPLLVVSNDIATTGIPVLSCRHVAVVAAAADAAWRISGSTSTKWLKDQGNAHWVDSETAADEMCDAYAVRLGGYAGGMRNQIDWACDHLRKDPESRQVWSSIWDSSRDGSDDRRAPCTLGYKLHTPRREGLLDMTVVMRSSDLIVGLLYDYTTAGFLLDMYAHELDMSTGRVTMVLLDAHIYGEHMQVARNIIYQAYETVNDHGLKAPCWSLSEVRLNMDGYMDAVREHNRARHMNTYKAKVDVPQ